MPSGLFFAKKMGTNHLRLSNEPLTVATSRSWRGWVVLAAQNLSPNGERGIRTPEGF